MFNSEESSASERVFLHFTILPYWYYIMPALISNWNVFVVEKLSDLEGQYFCIAQKKCDAVLWVQTSINHFELFAELLVCC